MGRLEGKVILVTGGGRGIGAATCAMVAREGARVAVTDIRDEAGRAVAEAIVAGGGQATFLHHDVASEAAWHEVMGAVVAAQGRVDGVVNNAGLCEGASVEDTTLDLWRRLMAVNLDGVFLGTREAIRAMKATGGGAIVNLSSIAGLVGDADLAAYNATKGGVRLLTKSAALHCARAGLGIRVNSVHPGAIRTPLLAALLDHRGDRQASEREVVGQHPLGRLGEPDEVACGVVYLLSDESRFVTGAELVVDGGFTAQ